MRTMLCLMSVLAICIPAHSQEQDPPIDHHITRTTSVIHKGPDGTLTVTPFVLRGDPRSPVYKQALAEEEDKLEQYQAEILRQPVRVRLAPQRLVCGESQNFAESLEHCDPCRDHCVRCNDHCVRTPCQMPCVRTPCQGMRNDYSVRGGPPLPSRGYYCNCANHIAECARLGLNWRTELCRCRNCGTHSAGTTRSSCCGH